MINRTIERGATLFLSACLVAILNSCGSGAVTGTNTDPASGATLAVLPPVAEAFPDIPVTLTISGGQSPFLVFSSNSVALPVVSLAAGISGTGPSFSLVANSVSVDTPVDVTVRDATAKTATAKLNIHPSTLNNQVTFTPLGPTGTGCGTGLCSGGDAQVVVKAVLNGVVLRSRAIRFDVYQGNFQLVTPGSGVLTSTLVVNTDEQGEAVVRVAATVSSPTQVATLQTTDVTSGLARRFNFSIIQATSGAGILSTLPSGAITAVGAKGVPGGSGFCPSGAAARVDYYVYGGTPPYTVASPLTSVVTVSPSVVQANGGSFTAQIVGCGKVSIIVTDASGRTVETAQIDAQQGADGSVVAPATSTLLVSPTAVTVGCGQIASVSLAGSGAFTTSIVTAGVSATAFNVSPTAGAIPSTLTFSRIAGTVITPTTAPSPITVNVVAGSTITPVTVTTTPSCP